MLDNPDNPKNSFIEKERIELEISEIAKKIKPEVIDFINQQNDKKFEWIIKSINDSRYLEHIVSELRHIPGGQLFVLQRLVDVAPNLMWYRAGTKQTFLESMGGGEETKKHFSEEELNTTIIDHGANGCFGEPSSVSHWFNITPRKNPILYSLSIKDLLAGVAEGAIRLVTEHWYDLKVVEGDRSKYLAFCKNKLKTEIPTV